MRWITLDTNIYISALNFGGAPLRILRMAVDGDVQIAISASLINELVRVLREKFKWSEDRVRDTQSLLMTHTVTVEPSKILDVIADDPTDNRVLECAVESGSAYR